jgi:ethanolamine phosphate phosphodiesterase
MAMGVRRPGFQLLSLVSPVGVPPGSQTLSDVPCILPDQLGIYLSVYVPLIALSLLALLLSNVYRVSYAHSSWSHGHLRTRSPTDEEQTSLWGSALPPLPRTLHVHDEPDDEDEDGEHSMYALPPPTPAVTVTGKARRGPSSLSRFVKIRSIRRLSYVFGCSGRAQTALRRREGLLHGFSRDVVQVAWVPVVLFVAIAWWMFL